MEYVRVANLRCIADSTRIELKPISLLVGANSSGKSSFIRLFPLIKQSLEFRSLGGLVLNEGEVDFGFFNEVLHKAADPQELKLDFGFSTEVSPWAGPQWNSLLTEPATISCELTYHASVADQHYARLGSLKLDICTTGTTDQIEIAFDDEGVISNLRINDLHVEDLFKSWRVRVGRSMVPRLLMVVSRDTPSSEYEARQDPIDQRLLSEARPLFHGRTSAETRLALFRSVGLGSAERMLSNIQQGGNSSWKASVSKWETTTAMFVTIRNLLIAKRLNDLLEVVGGYLAGLANDVRYFAPVRARVERDYLSRDLPVAYVDPTGVNVATMLSSFPPISLLAFRKWMTKHFGFEVFPKTVAGGARISLRLKEAGSGMEFNLADTGFGFSQMLPFLVEIYSLTEGKSFKGRTGLGRNSWSSSRSVGPGPLIAIEQPELHLHPAMQAKLADFVVQMARLGREAGIPIRFMLETHSPVLIERIGEAVEKGLLAMADVQVLLFQLDKDITVSNTAGIRKVQFDKHGVLQDWPYGFLSADAPTAQ